jgi:hypothetical protein
MKFDKQQLEKWIDHELSFLRYYGYREDRMKLTIDSNIYEDVRSIGYAKRTMPLSHRCIPATIKCDTEINSNTKIEDLYVITERKNNQSYSPCEVFMKIFPDRRKEIIDILRNQESNPPTKVYI